jgi:predicted LPLAT superfamily acyltransferase
MMGDRASGEEKSCTRVSFLGEDAPFPFSAFQIASAAGVPVVVLFTCKTAPDRYSLNVAKIITVPRALGRAKHYYMPYVAQFAEELEKYVQAHPYQFYNFYDMWS